MYSTVNSQKEDALSISSKTWSCEDRLIEVSLMIEKNIEKNMEGN